MLGKANQKTDAKAILGLADLPGFGYAKLSKEVQAAVQQAAERYLNNREELALCILLVDARRVPSDDDRAVLAALYDLGLPIVVAATKVDKLSRNEVDSAMAIIQERLGLPDGQPLCVSSVTGEGTKEMWRIIMEACETKVEELTQKLQRVGSKDGDVESIQLDDEGNLIQPDEDEDIAYDQGYDWIQNSNIVYDYGEVDTEAFSATDEEDYFDYSDVSESDSKESESLKFKDLKRKIRRMERRGEI
jgi:GTP-binding protein